MGQRGGRGKGLRGGGARVGGGGAHLGEGWGCKQRSMPSPQWSCSADVLSCGS